MTEDIKKPYWLDSDIIKQASAFGEILSGSGLGGEDFKDKDSCTVLVLLALKYKTDPIQLLQSACRDMYGRLFFTAAGIQQILYGFFGAGVEITKKYDGDWSRIKGKVIVERSTTPWITLKNWTDDDESELSIEVTINAKGQTYKLKTFLSSIPDNYRMANSNWAINPDQQLYYYSLTRLVRMELPFILDGFNTEDEQEHYVPIKTINASITTESISNDENKASDKKVIESLDIFMANRQQRKYESMPLDDFYQLTLDVCISHFDGLLKNNNTHGLDKFMRQQITQMPLSEHGKVQFQEYYRSFEKQISALYEH